MESYLSAEDKARDEIDKMLEVAGWAVQDAREANLAAAHGVAVREFILEPPHGRADYLLFVDREAVGVIEAKPEGATLTGVEWQSAQYLDGLPDWVTSALEGALPFAYQSTGVETRFTNTLDPEARSRQVFWFHRPETLAAWDSNADALHKAICNSVAAGVTYVVAAGNSGTNFASFVPAAYPEAVTVTAVSDSDGLPGGLGGAPSCRTSEGDDTYASFSNYAGASDSTAKAHTIAGPGVCIKSTWLGGGYNTISGTSMATPHVSGAVALCISGGKCSGGASPSSIISAIRTFTASQGFTGDPNSPVSGRYYGYIVSLGIVAPPAPTVPGAPTLSSATAGSAQVALAWTAPASTGGATITNYKIYRGTTSGGETLLTTLGNVTAYTDNGLANGTTYYYKVAAVNSVGTSSLSNERSATPQSVTVGVPTAPTNVTAKQANGRGLQVSWNAPSSTGGSAITSYEVWRSSGGAYALLATQSGSSTGFKDTSTARNTSYSYEIRAVNAVGPSPYSSPSAFVAAT